MGETTAQEILPPMIARLAQSSTAWFLVSFISRYQSVNERGQRLYTHGRFSATQAEKKSLADDLILRGQRISILLKSPGYRQGLF